MEWSKFNAKCLKLNTPSRWDTPVEFSNPTELSPVDRVILLPEILEKILGYCVYGSDLKTMLNLRLVCRVWKSCAFSAILNFIDELPTIVAGSEKFLMETRLRRSQNVNWRSLESFHGTFKSSCEPPVKLAVNSVWDKSVVKVFERFAHNVVSIHHYNTRDCYIAKEIFQYTCPSLKHVTLSCFKACGEKRKKFITLLELIKHLIDNTPSGLSSFEVELHPYYKSPSPNPNSFPIRDSAFDLLQHEKITGLDCVLPFFLQITKNHPMKNLKAAHIFDLNHRFHEDSVVEIPFLQDKGENLTELELSGGLETQYQISEMKNLQVLKVHSLKLVAVGTVISKLLPNLRKLEVEGEGGMISVFLERKNVFEKVEEIKFFHQGDMFAMDGVDIFVPLALRFPNLTMLDYACTEANLGRLATVTHTIFNKLQRLRVLKLRMHVTSVQDLFLLLINTSPNKIPKDRATWRTSLDSLVRSRNGIWNMQNMKFFQLQTSSGGRKRVGVPLLESDFLFNAAFGLIKSLRSLKFRGINFHKDNISSWRSSGRSYITQ